MTRGPESKYQIGDVVRVVDTPYKDCPFGWVGDMDECCSREATIEYVYWDNGRNIYGYIIDIDDYNCIWCENCFIVDQDLEESDLDPIALFQQTNNFMIIEG